MQFNISRIGATAAVALFALSAPALHAQDDADGAGNGAQDPGGSSVTQDQQDQTPGGTPGANDQPSADTGGDAGTSDAGETGTAGSNATGADATGETPATGDGETAQGATGSDTSGQAMTAQNSGQTVMLDVEGFAQQIYERGYRQGYLSGITDARSRMMEHMRQMRSHHSQMQGQSGQMQRGGQGMAGMAPQGGQDGRGSSGSIIVLPPGVSPEAFIDQMMRNSR